MRYLALALLLVTALAHAGTAYFKYETGDDGMYKVCVYDYRGSDIHISIRSHQLCPLTIQV